MIRDVIATCTISFSKYSRKVAAVLSASFQITINDQVTCGEVSVSGQVLHCPLGNPIVAGLNK